MDLTNRGRVGRYRSEGTEMRAPRRTQRRRHHTLEGQPNETRVEVGAKDVPVPPSASLACNELRLELDGKRVRVPPAERGNLMCSPMLRL